jgi:hypothetical protein
MQAAVSRNRLFAKNSGRVLAAETCTQTVTTCRIRTPRVRISRSGREILIGVPAILIATAMGAFTGRLQVEAWRFMTYLGVCAILVAEHAWRPALWRSCCTTPRRLRNVSAGKVQLQSPRDCNLVAAEMSGCIGNVASRLAQHLA